jgi:leader peptidase (prepilin peptidase)/N-methyltransferase
LAAAVIVWPPLPVWLPPLLAAPFVGSLLGVLILRLPAGRPVTWSRSACDHCGASLGPAELVPIASFLLQKGRCRRCGRLITPFHFAIELAATALVVPAALLQADPLELWLDCVLGWTLLALAWIDWRTLRLPDVLTLPLLLLGLAVTLVTEPTAITQHVAAAALGYMSFWAIATVYRHLRGRDGLGAGDAKLFAAAGAWLGLAMMPWVLLLASSAGLVAALGLAMAGRRIAASTALPFGPWLALSLWLLWLWQGLSDRGQWGMIG